MTNGWHDKRQNDQGKTKPRKVGKNGARSMTKTTTAGGARKTTGK